MFSYLRVNNWKISEIRKICHKHGVQSYYGTVQLNRVFNILKIIDWTIYITIVLTFCNSGTNNNDPIFKPVLTPTKLIKRESIPKWNMWDYDKIELTCSCFEHNVIACCAVILSVVAWLHESNSISVSTFLSL